MAGIPDGWLDLETGPSFVVCFLQCVECALKQHKDALQHKFLFAFVHWYIL